MNYKSEDFFIWANENCNTLYLKNWYLNYNGLIHARIKEHLNGYLVFNENNLRGIYFDLLPEAKTYCELNIY